MSELLYAPASGECPPRDAPRPRGRINAQLAVSGSTLYVYGGIVEIGDKEITLDDLWSLSLKVRVPGRGRGGRRSPEASTHTHVSVCTHALSL